MAAAMRILVTGGAGFLGSHLVDSLLATGHEVAVVDNLCAATIDRVPADVRFFEIDVRDDLADVFREARPEVVVHLAAQVSVPHSVTDPRRDLSVNVDGTINVVTTAGGYGVRKVVFVSSAAVYGIPKRLPITEDQLLAPVSPYGLSKRTGESYVALLAGVYGLSYTLLRPANLYGPRQRADGEGAVVPSFLQRFGSGRDPVIHGNGGQTRDFVYVGDMVHAVARCLVSGNGGVFNISSGVGTAVIQLWTELAECCGWDRPPLYGPSRAGDIPHSILSSERARRELGWQAETPIRVGLKRTVEWYLASCVGGLPHESMCGGTGLHRLPHGLPGRKGRP